jgi:hypothetical protein
LSGFLSLSQTNSFDVIYGGGESNVAVSLANYGVPARFVSRISNNDIGDCVPLWKCVNAALKRILCFVEATDQEFIS